MAHSTLGEWIAYATGRLARARLVFGHGAHRPSEEAVWLAMHVLGLPYEKIDGSLGRALTRTEQAKADKLLEQRIETRKPLAYLLKEAWLQDRRFYVDERVIVPRSFIAELLPKGLKPWLPRPGAVKQVLDMCTGSGCLAILAAQAYPAAMVTGADISPAALAVAKKNVSGFRLGRRVKLVRSDLFAAVKGTYDLILSNPPYVTAADMRKLPAEYRHEPALALAGGADGLDAVDVLLKEAPRHLSPRGVLVVEIGHNRKALERRYRRVPFTWLSTSAGDGMVFLLSRDQLT